MKIKDIDQIINHFDAETKILEAIYHKYGHRNQLLKLAEECSELARACCRIVMDQDQAPGREIDMSNFCEEIADVQILIDQFYHFHCGQEILQARQSKIERIKTLL
jgi:NTP pyrophosphatase (non-canonical NTP hydrolase)